MSNEQYYFLPKLSDIANPLHLHPVCPYRLYPYPAYLIGYPVSVGIRSKPGTDAITQSGLSEGNYDLR